jgi:hypothetical protein
VIRVYDDAGNVIETIRRKRESLIVAPRTQSAFHPLAQRNAFRRRDVRQQSRSFRPQESIAETQPQLQPGLLRLSVALLIVVDYLRRRFARFKLRAHFLGICAILGWGSFGPFFSPGADRTCGRTIRAVRCSASRRWRFEPRRITPILKLRSFPKNVQ